MAEHDQSIIEELGRLRERDAKHIKELEEHLAAARDEIRALRVGPRDQATWAAIADLCRAAVDIRGVLRVDTVHCIAALCFGPELTAVGDGDRSLAKMRATQESGDETRWGRIEAGLTALRPFTDAQRAWLHAWGTRPSTVAHETESSDPKGEKS